MTLKERLVTIITEHVKASPFRHYYVVFFAALFCLVLGIVELLALIWQGYVLQHSDPTIPTYNTLYVGSQIAVNIIPIFIFALIAYIAFVQITYVIMVHRNMVVDEYSIWNTIAIYVKIAIVIGLTFLILGINQQTIMVAAMIIGLGIFAFLAPRIWDYISNRVVTS
jgi:hypothetical protein